MDRPRQLSPLSESIIQTLAYYDLFDHPLTASEIFFKLPTNHITLNDLESELPLLVNQSIIYRFGTYYSLQNNRGLESRRVNGNRLAEKMMRIAASKANTISGFPFVRGVMISGSLSKGYADEQSDIDFFIVTQPERLWIARMLLVIYKRIFLLNSHKYFCINYYIDSSHLEIGEKNIFTATELATLIPLYGPHYHHKLLQHNRWIESYFPNFKPDFKPQHDRQDGRLKKAMEWMLNRCFPDWLDRFFMRLTLRRWKRKYEQAYPKSEFNIAFKTNRHVSKNHPKNYQHQIVRKFEDKLNNYRKQLNTYTVS